MSDDKERSAEIIDAHQELVSRIEQSTGRIRALSIVTVVVALILAVSYVSQLILPLTGTSTVTVHLADPVNVALELFVFALAIVWLYVGVSDYRFSSRVRAQIVSARSKEKIIEEKIALND
jgi:hypothetical protein